MCDYHEGDKAIFWFDENNNVLVDSHGEIMVTTTNKVLRFKVPYCPMCGKKFGVNYHEIKKDDEIYYVDMDGGIIEHGSVCTISFKDGNVDSIGIDFDDKTFDVFDGTKLGKCLFVDKQEAENALRNGRG